MLGALIFLLVFFSLLLVSAADVSVVALRRVARATRLGTFAISAIILAVGTSFPELSVSLASALSGVSQVTLGVIIGSNISNIALIGSLAALIHGRVIIHGDYLTRDYLLSCLAGLLPVVLMVDGGLSKIDGLILLVSYLAYTTSLFRARFLEMGEEIKHGTTFFVRFWKQVNHMTANTTREYGKLFIGIALMLFSSDIIIKLSQELARLANVPVFLLGLIVLAVGTSLPEFAFSLRSLEDGQPRMFFGNLLGSTIANSTLIIGLSAVISPVTGIDPRGFYLAAAVFVIVSGVFWLFVRSKRRLDRWEAVTLILIYGLFVVLEFSGNI